MLCARVVEQAHSHSYGVTDTRDNRRRESGIGPSGAPSYTNAPTRLPVLLWHEFIGHSTKGLKHPAEPWNTYEFRDDVPLPVGWGRIDPVIVIEDMARIRLR